MRWYHRPPNAKACIRPDEEVDAYRIGSSALGEHLVRDHALLSPQGRYIAVEDAGHFIHLDQPDRVFEAIREVVEDASR